MIENAPVRRALLADAPLLYAIDLEVSEFPWSQSQYGIACGDQDASEQVLVIGVGEVVAGFVVYNCVLTEGNIYNIAIAPQYQRGGLGSNLLLATMEAMAESGAEKCMLDVRTSNQAARALYTSSGFVEDGVRKDYYRTESGREDAVLMSRHL